MSRILIKNGRLINPENNRDEVVDILIEGDVIRKIEKNIAQNFAKNISEEVKIIDAAGMIVAPGFVDVHSHFRDPGFTYKEDIHTGALAAAAGGYTTIVLMANTKPTVDNEDTLQYVMEKAAQEKINITTCCNVTKGMMGTELADMKKLCAMGAVGVTDDGKPILDAGLVEEAMRIAKELDVPISFHEENPKFITNNGVNKGKASEHYGIGGSPREAEIDMIGRDLEIALKTGACIDIQHISSKEGVELVRQAKKKGGDIHAEATPHHFSLTEEAVIEHGTMAKMNPPLRTEEDRQAILNGLKDGTIDLIATDHAPHSAEEKAKPITEAPSGIIGLETALPLAITNLVRPGILNYMELIERMSYAPAKMYHFDRCSVKEGAKADLVIFDPEEKKAVGPFRSKSQNSPFTGQELYGVVRYTICAGEIVWEN